MAGGTRFVGLDVLLYVDLAEAVAAQLDRGTGNAGVRFKARIKGTAGNSINIVFAAGSGNSLPTTVGVSGSTITVTLGTSSGGTVNATALQVRDAVNAHAAASALVIASLLGDGSGLAAAAVSAPLVGGTAKGSANYQPVAHQKDLELDDSTDTATATSKNGGGFGTDFPTIRSISFELNALRCYDEPTQDRLERAYQDREEIVVQYTIPARLTGSTDRIKRAPAILTSFSESFPETDMAMVSAGVSLQEAWTTV